MSSVGRRVEKEVGAGLDAQGPWLASRGADNLTGVETGVTFRQTKSMSIGVTVDWTWVGGLSLAVEAVSPSSL